MFCSKCGKEVEAGQKFCPYCGSPMISVEGSTKKAETTGKRKKKKKLPLVLTVVGILVVILILGVVIFENGSDIEISDYLNMDEDEFLEKTGYKKSKYDYYPSRDIPIYAVDDGKVSYVGLSENITEDDNYADLCILGLKPGMKLESEKISGYRKLDSKDYSVVYTNNDEDCILTIGFDKNSKKIKSISMMAASKEDIEADDTDVQQDENSDISSSSEDADTSSVSSGVNDDSETLNEDDDSGNEEDTHQQIMEESGEFIFPDSNKVVEDSGDIEQLSDDDLRIAINEIYARHGYHFKSADLQEYFNSTRWYEDEGITNQSEITAELNKYEKENLENLTAERANRN